MVENGTPYVEKPKILIVDDRPENLYVLEKLLARLDVNVIKALSGTDALTSALEHEFCVAIVDIQMPEMDGYELVELLRSNASTAALPIIFVSAIYSDEYHHRKAYETGAVDFLSKPFIPEILISKIKVFIDLYQQRKVIEQANAELRQASLDKDKFFSIISHDLRAPFNVVLGFAQLLELRAKKYSPEEIEEIANSIYSGAKSAYALLDNLLTWARLQREKGLSISAEALELNAIASEAISVYEQIAANKEITLVNAVPADVWVKADRRMIETIIRNLTGNAIKFTPRGGKVSIVALNGINGTSNMISVGIQDTGIGMSPAVKAKLFRIDIRHSTLGTEQEAGSGLGLVISQEMVERNGGRIWVESEEGKGTTMWFTVPTSHQGKTAAESSANAPETSSAGSGEKV